MRKIKAHGVMIIAALVAYLVMSVLMMFPKHNHRIRLFLMSFEKWNYYFAKIEALCNLPID